MAERAWISRRQAMRILQIGPVRLAALAIDGYIRVRRVPGGGRTWYWRLDVERLAEPTPVGAA